MAREVVGLEAAAVGVEAPWWLIIRNVPSCLLPAKRGPH